MGDVVCVGRSYWDEGYHRIRHDQKVSPKGVNYWDKGLDWIHIWVRIREKHLLDNEMLVTYGTGGIDLASNESSLKSVLVDIHQLFPRAGWVV